MLCSIWHVDCFSYFSDDGDNGLDDDFDKI